MTTDPDCLEGPGRMRDLERKLGEAHKARKALADAADHLNARLREEQSKLADATNVMRAATVLIAAKGRHNTMLAYNGLREALARIDAPLTPNPESRNVTP